MRKRVLNFKGAKVITCCHEKKFNVIQPSEFLLPVKHNRWRKKKKKRRGSEIRTRTGKRIRTTNVRDE